MRRKLFSSIALSPFYSLFFLRYRRFPLLPPVFSIYFLLHFLFPLSFMLSCILSVIWALIDVNRFFNACGICVPRLIEFPRAISLPEDLWLLHINLVLIWRKLNALSAYGFIGGAVYDLSFLLEFIGLDVSFLLLYVL